MDSWISGPRVRLNRIEKTLFGAINIILIVMGVVLIIVGGEALKKVSKIDTDNIRPLIDTITVDGIQPLGAVQYLFRLSLGVGVGISIMIILVSVPFVCDGGRIRLLVLAMYTIYILMLITWVVAVIIQWDTSKDKVENEIKSKMILALDHFKADTITNSNPISNAWNFLFMSLNCCGVTAVVSTTNDFDATPWCTISGSCQATSSQIPKTCCRNVDENSYTSAPAGCHASVNSGTYNTEGCYNALKEMLLTYSSSIIAVVCTTLILEILAAVLFCYILIWKSSNAVNSS